MLIWPTKHVTSLTLSYKQTVAANGIIAIAPIHRRTVNVYIFLSVGPTYRAMDKVVACRTISFQIFRFSKIIPSQILYALKHEIRSAITASNKVIHNFFCRSLYGEQCKSCHLLISNRRS